MRNLLRISAVGIVLVIGAFAQNAQIAGRITDPTGGVVPSANITVTNTHTGATYPTLTNSEGYFTVTRLDPGEYRVAVSASGFKPLVRSGLLLQVDQMARVDLGLQVGSLSESVEVSGEAPLVESETSTIGQVVNNKSIVEMPLNGRGAWGLMQLAGAVTFITGERGVGIATVAGSRTQATPYLLDGGAIQKSGLAVSHAELVPMVDAVQEFKVVTNNYAAEYGRTAAGVITAVTKSGTNQFHGNVFEFFRNDKLDARNFFSASKAPLRFNQYGGTFGGPVRKDKTHFFMGLENNWSSTGSTAILTLPTAAMKSGDFTGQPAIYNPSSTRPDPTDPTRSLRDPVPGNRIPANLIDPVAAKIASFYPDPNFPGITNNWRSNFSAVDKQYHGTVKIDHAISARDRLAARYVGWYAINPQAKFFPEPASDPANAGRDVTNLAHTWLGSWTRTVSPSIVNDLRFNFTNQERWIAHKSAGGDWPEKLGLKGVPPDVFPVVQPQAYTALGNLNAKRYQTNPFFQVVESISRFTGTHGIKAGFLWQHNGTSDEFDKIPSGRLAFVQQGSGLQSIPSSGNGFATMLFGFATTGEVNDQAYYKFHSDFFGVYLQDDWKITPRLTLNLGIRYDIETARVSPDNTSSGFNPTKINPAARVPGVVTFAGVGGEPRALFNPDRNDVAPRFGFAWRPFGDKTVVRGGAGLFFAPSDAWGFNNTAVLGFSTQSLLVSPDNNQTAAFLLRNGFPGVKAPTAADRNDGFAVNGPVDYYERQRHTPYAYMFNFGLQHQLKSVLVSAEYLSNLGHKLTSPPVETNQIRPELVGKAGTLQSRRPFPQFTSVMIDSPNWGASSYHGLLLRAEKRYENGLQFLFNYTFSKFIDNVEGMNYEVGNATGYMDFYNRRIDKSISGNNVRHMSSFNLIYDLPFGPGRTWLRSGVLSQILGGWQASALGRVRSGSPFGVVTTTNTTEAFSSGAQRADILGDPRLPEGQRTIQKWFRTEMFAQPARFAFGNSTRGQLEAPGVRNFDLGIMKNFVIAERFRVQFRGELFNGFNLVNFGQPNATFGNPGFGTITGAGAARVIQLGLKLYF